MSAVVPLDAVATIASTMSRAVTSASAVVPLDAVTTIASTMSRAVVPLDAVATIVSAVVPLDAVATIASTMSRVVVPLDAVVANRARARLSCEFSGLLKSELGKTPNLVVCEFFT